MSRGAILSCRRSGRSRRVSVRGGGGQRAGGGGAAQKGIYPESMLAPVPASLRRKYVNLARQPGSRSVRIAPMLRSRIGFARLNFMDSFYPVGEAMDVIFCRNVLIYFDKPTQSQVLARLCDCLRPGGFLIIGHSETVAGFNLPLRTVSNTVFRKL